MTNLPMDVRKMLCRERLPNKVVINIIILCGIFHTYWQALREKCPNMEIFQVRIFLYSDWIRRFTD